LYIPVNINGEWLAQMHVGKSFNTLSLPVERAICFASA